MRALICYHRSAESEACIDPPAHLKDTHVPPFTDPAFEALVKSLRQYRLASTLAQVAGLLTVPALQPYILRLELLLIGSLVA